MGKAVIGMSRLVKIVDNKYVQIEECRNPNICFNTSEYDDFEDYCTLRETFDPFEMFYENQELKEKLDKYENPEDMTLYSMWCTEKVKDENKQLKDLIDTILNFSFFKEECPLNFGFENSTNEDKSQSIFYEDEWCENNCNDNYKDCWLKYFKKLQELQGSDEIMLSIKDTEKRRKLFVENTTYCKCGHSIAIPKAVDRVLCTWCNCYAYRTPELEEKYKKEEFKRKIGKMIK